MYFSFRGERKVPKESPLKESTQVLSLRILSPVRRALLPGGKRALCAVTSQVDGCPQPRRSAELAGFPPIAGMCDEFPLSSPRFGRGERGRRSAVRAGYRVSTIFRAI